MNVTFFATRFVRTVLMASCVLSLMSSQHAYANTKCVHPELASVAKGRYCSSEPILYRLNGRVENAELAAVTIGFTTDSDVIFAKSTYFLRIPGGHVIDLGSFPQGESRFMRTPERIFNQLEYSVSGSGGWVRMNLPLFYERLIENIAGAYCMIYRMKLPFAGEFFDCDGGGNPGGRVGYLPGTISQAEARRRICELIKQETAQPCGNNSVMILRNSLERDSDGRAYYQVDARRTIRSYLELTEMTHAMPKYEGRVEYDDRTYRVEAEGGGITLISQGAMLCGQQCTPLRKESSSH